MSSAKDKQQVKEEPTAHLSRADKLETFCGEAIVNGTWLSVTIESSTCDTCVQRALAEGAAVGDRRGGPKSLGEILPELLARLQAGGEVFNSVGLSPEGESVCEHFDIRAAELKDAPRDLLGEQYLDLPAHVLSKRGWFPTPETLVVSLLSFYIDVLKQNVHAGEISEAQGVERLARVKRMIAFCSEGRGDEVIKSEYPITVDQWPEEYRR